VKYTTFKQFTRCIGPMVFNVAAGI